MGAAYPAFTVVLQPPGEPEATGWAAQCPAALYGAIEVRQVAFSPL